ncbi:glycine betaine ABC transporter substrate-binding protein [Devosia sp. MC1541]|uniref:glycine betaine ABC transporter substrate-binding protein n=1 Tax=Devosia sp. MC1541 TaxID=2725264 RepID=UPI00145E96F2|nr:glycine betaine ABC transporter substrate-binding protein [Devosia sp. MC1541]
MHRQAITGLFLAAMTISAQAQFSVLNDGAAPSEATPSTAESVALPACGTQPIAMAKMGWPSAALLAEVHANILREAYDCDVQFVQGDLAATASSMGAAALPTVAPEMWVSRIAEVWNSAMDSQLVRSAAPSYDTQSFEGWFMPTQTAQLFTGAPNLANLAEAIPLLSSGEKIPFISCPVDWACSIINRNLIEALGLGSLVEVVEPANRFEMDKLIAEAVNKRDAFLFYYWQPNPVLAQLDFTPVDMGAYDEAAAKCLASLNCALPKPSAFAPETVVIALSENLVVNSPLIAGYFQRATLSLKEMDAMLAELSQPGASEEAVAAQFVERNQSIWRAWVSPEEIR